jgi:hypothetical protein
MARILFFISFPAFIGCNLLTEDDKVDKCNDTKISPSIEKEFYLVDNIDTNLTSPTNEYRLFDAIEIEYHGAVRMMSCLDEELEYKPLDHTVYRPHIIDNLVLTYQTSPSYVFRVDNKYNYLKFNITMRAVFSDGKIFESDEYVGESLKYYVIQSNQSMNNKYFVQSFAAIFSKWHEVVK